MKKIIFFLLLLFVLANTYIPVFAEETSASETESDYITFDSGSLSFEDSSNITIKNHVAGVTGMIAFNLLLSTWNRYMIGSNWAQTGPDEWLGFWNRDLAWDTDWYWTNFVLHPYQGGLYYMAARGAGLNYLESFAITVAGSAFWEYLCETNAPSKNDMVYTTFGAFAMGEMLYRLSAEANEISRILGVVLNPMRLWTEDLWGIKQRSTSGNIYELSVAFNIGSIRAHTDIPDYSGDYPDREIYPFFIMPELSVVYNDPYRHDSNIPYSQFELDIKTGIGHGSGYASNCRYESVDEDLFYNINIMSSGMLFSRTLDFADNIDTSAGMVFEYDFNWHSFFEISSLAMGGAIKQRINIDGGASRFEWQAHLAGIILGTADYYYYHRDLVDDIDGIVRTYSYTTGFQNVLKLKYVTKKGKSVAMDFHGYAMYDFYNQKQFDASTGWEYIGILTSSFEIPLSYIMRVGVADEIYVKRTFYRDAADVFQLANTGKVYAKFQLK